MHGTVEHGEHPGRHPGRTGASRRRRRTTSATPLALASHGATCGGGRRPPSAARRSPLARTATTPGRRSWVLDLAGTRTRPRRPSLREALASGQRDAGRRVLPEQRRAACPRRPATHRRPGAYLDAAWPQGVLRTSSTCAAPRHGRSSLSRIEPPAAARRCWLRRTDAGAGVDPWPICAEIARLGLPRRTAARSGGCRGAEARLGGTWEPFEVPARRASTPCGPTRRAGFRALFDEGRAPVPDGASRPGGSTTAGVADGSGGRPPPAAGVAPAVNGVRSEPEAVQRVLALLPALLHPDEQLEEGAGLHLPAHRRAHLLQGLRRPCR